MEDRFRFRAWDKEEKDMIYQVEKLYDGNLSAYPAQSFGELFELKMQDDNFEDTEELRYIVMQCTGLKDKNGKLIFEGDIFEKKDSFGMDLVIVEWASDMWHLRSTLFPSLSPGNYRLEYYAEKLKIIGNKYENPELLEESNE